MRRVRRDRSGQGEILGLAVVVILVMVGFMLAVRLGGIGEDSPMKQAVIDRQTASAMINVMLHTNLDCKDITLAEVIQDCANPQSAFEYCEPSPGSPKRLACEEAEYVTGTIVERTLREWGRGYLLRVYTGSGEDLEIQFEHSYMGCGKGLSDAEKERFPMPTKSGSIYLELTICAPAG